MNSLLYGVFALDLAQELSINKIPLLELLRAPFAINLGILGVAVVWLCRQRSVRLGLTLLGLACLLVMTGLIFTSLLLAAAVGVWLLARVLQRWALRRGRHGLPLLVGWVVVNGLYFPLFFITLPQFGPFMSVGELVLFWGPAFFVFRSLHYLHMACKGRVDPFVPEAFADFLLYVVHFASFWFGPYQKFAQFGEEVATCKQRQTAKNQFKGWLRILMGLGKFLILFHFFNIDHFYRFGYFGPFTDTLFADAGSAEPGHLWLMMYLFAFRMMLFISALSDGVIGMNLLMGIRVPENSNWPILSRDIMDFWRRWHVQTGVFLREEVFFPSGGMRKRRLGFFCVFAYSGFWHFPAWTSILLFPLVQLALFELTIAWQGFWKFHDRREDQISEIGRRLYLHDSLPSGVVGFFLVLNSNVLTIAFIHDHFHHGSRILPALLGF
ncbi:D-alanyl-lipoteichoic acid acyltransferase DltB (MBOAT superfamily) [Hoeflea marina]|uniref:D-alanyl-lipoteichoic acid acyltransferase DltB (MBOAT superfamily) n=1 Tax=Hoeflea marina TaxID=274592 RepID=A0A317PGV2_9HYPH|nr:MBOAT family O-acyltransferase [Hoeflea marina]PWV99244.1 D-alanyl-lipoteichoic acid acyltransferase DltB (MBOAT superfamily) [Hoeflea marina]